MSVIASRHDAAIWLSLQCVTIGRCSGHGPTHANGMCCD
jgi:hypothetical protein